MHDSGHVIAESGFEGGGGEDQEFRDLDCSSGFSWAALSDGDNSPSFSSILGLGLGLRLGFLSQYLESRDHGLRCVIRDCAAGHVVYDRNDEEDCSGTAYTVFD